MDVFYVYLLLLTELILFGIAWKQFNGDFISPSIVTLGFFILSTICFIYNINNWDVVFSLKAYLLFAISFLLMVFVEKFVASHHVVLYKKNKRVKYYPYNSQYIICGSKGISEILPFLLICLAFFYIYRVYRSGMRFGASNILTAIGYNKEEGDFDALARLMYNLIRLSSYAYIIMVCNNICAAKEKITKNIKEIAVVAITVLITFFSGQRSAAICYIIAIVVGIGISLNISENFKRSKNSKKWVRKLFIIAIGVLTIFYLSANIVKGTNIQRDPVYYLTYYFGSTTALMGKIVSNPELCHEPFVGYFGEKTFSGFWSTMYSWGFIDYPPADRKWIHLGGAVTSSGNEYTFFCGPYIDFGFWGAILFIVIFYFIFTELYYWKIKKNYNYKGKFIISSIYIFLYTMVAMSFYQDTIRTYTRPINILYIIYIIAFCKIFFKIRRIYVKADSGIMD